jgi:ankyrin repeat protein
MITIIGDFLAEALSEEPKVLPVSKAPAGTGEQLRKLAQDGNITELSSLVLKWKNDPVINEPDSIGTTPLHTAASHNHIECVQVLLSAGADKTIKNNYGQLPIAKTHDDKIKELLSN